MAGNKYPTRTILGARGVALIDHTWTVMRLIFIGHREFFSIKS